MYNEPKCVETPRQTLTDLVTEIAVVSQQCVRLAEIIPDKFHPVSVSKCKEENPNSAGIENTLLRIRRDLNEAVANLDNFYSIL